jgi:beta-xylosidase
MEEQGKVIIDDKEYDYAELEPDEKYFVNQVRNLKARITQAQFDLDQLLAARNAFTNSLVKSVQKNPTPEEKGTE